MNTKEFLQHFPDFYVQTFDDTHAKRPELVRLGNSKQIDPKALRTLNLAGAGVFFTPNRFVTSRKAENCEGINAWFFEIDNISIDEQWGKVCAAPLMPSLVVRSKKSLHCYFLAEDGTIENFRNIQKGLIQYFNSDPACKDVCRVLRIPGFKHMKETPFDVEIIWDKANKYTEAEIMKAYPYIDDTVSISAPQKTGNEFWDAMTAIPTKLVLERMSGTAICNGERFTFRPRSSGGEYIDVNDKTANAWIDKRGYIGSGNNGGPTFIQWLQYYGRTKAEIATWAKENFEVYLPKDIPDAVEATEVSAVDLLGDMDKLMEAEQVFTWGTKKLDEIFTPILKGRYIVLVGETGAGKTAWAFHLAKKNAELGNRVLYLSLEMTNESLLMRYALRKLGVTKLEWKEGKYDKEKVRQLIRELPKTLSFKKIELKGGEIDLEYISKTVREGYDMVFIDNFGFIQTTGGESMNERVATISRAMVALKKETNVVIFALHHFRKTSSDKKERGLNAILGSSKISHDVDFAVQVHRNMDLDPDSAPHERAELIVSLMKDRDFGDYSISPVYFVDGEFHDSFYKQIIDVPYFA